MQNTILKIIKIKSDVRSYIYIYIYIYIYSKHIFKNFGQKVFLSKDVKNAEKWICFTKQEIQKTKQAVHIMKGALKKIINCLLHGKVMRAIN